MARRKHVRTNVNGRVSADTKTWDQLPGEDRQKLEAKLETLLGKSFQDVCLEEYIVAQMGKGIDFSRVVNSLTLAEQDTAKKLEGSVRKKVIK
jgi:hypothetical protein